MKRTTRMGFGRQTVAIIEVGSYRSPDGRDVDISEAVRTCLAGTRFYPPEELKRIRAEVLADSRSKTETKIEVINETTLVGISRIIAEGQGPVVALNFASAKNPGGGFLGGSQAQEESLARSSALHASLLQAWDFYERHRAASTLLYSDAMIMSPNCPIIRDDDGALLEEPRLACFITSAAPNAGAAAKSRPDELSQIPEVFRRRSEFILALAAHHGYKHLVLGAWGCGVFRNDPSVVAAAFADHLKNGLWRNRFERISFCVGCVWVCLETFRAFTDAFA